MIMSFLHLAMLACVPLAASHGYLAKPVSRNAVGIYANGYCEWYGAIPCTGCAHCFNQEEVTTGCGIIQSKVGSKVYGDGELSFARTG